MRRVGLVGCGAIGSEVARALQRDYRNVARLTALYDNDRLRAVCLAQELKPHPAISVSIGSLVRSSELIIEAASVEVAGPLAAEALHLGRSVLIMSVGGLLRDLSWQRLARRSRGKVYVPSGALAGLDGVKAMAIGRIRRVALTTRKPPRALAAAPYVRQRGWRLSRLRRPRLLFEGTPQEVVKAFPQNTNIAATLLLSLHHSGATKAGSFLARRTRIRLVADPALRLNVHELEVVSDCGRIRCLVESRSSRNPKTSELAVRSAVAALERVFGSVAIGT